MSARKEIVVVSGIPRAGTSLMMQMLAAGGIPPLCDERRTADRDNPRGYFEYERVKTLKLDDSWVPSARGRAVKVVSQLLCALPRTEHYRVLFMHRDMDEAVRSQEKMLLHRGQSLPDPVMIKRALQLHIEQLLRWLRMQPHMDLLEVSYNKLLSMPETPIRDIGQFLDLRSPLQRLHAAIDPALYRNRVNEIWSSDVIAEASDFQLAR